MTSSLPKLAVNLNSDEFRTNAEKYYTWMLQEAPICRGKVSIMNVMLVSRYDACKTLLKDKRFVRNRANATGAKAFPFPMPNSIKIMLKGLISQDDPSHKRQRKLVAKAFTPKALSHLESRVHEITDELFDKLKHQKNIDLLDAYCLPVPVIMIQEMLGVKVDDMPAFLTGLSALTDGLNGLSLVRTMAFDIPKLVKLVEAMIETKRQNPADDILTALIHAEEEGEEKLSHDELLAMVFTLIMAGYETTVHLLGNGIVTMLDHPQSLEQLRANPALIDSAVEEILRVSGPIDSTKPNYASEDIELDGVLIPKRTPVFPVLGAANRDPDHFENPALFDITRTPNKHLSFGFGVHHCLGASLARMEARVALKKILIEAPNLRLDVPSAQLKRAQMPMWFRYLEIPGSLA